jgi:hypothetical protein
VEVWICPAELFIVAFGITKVLKEFPPLIVWETVRELTVREGVIRFPATMDPDEI